MIRLPTVVVDHACMAPMVPVEKVEHVALKDAPLVLCSKISSTVGESRALNRATEQMENSIFRTGPKSYAVLAVRESPADPKTYFTGFTAPLPCASYSFASPAMATPA